MDATDFALYRYLSRDGLARFWGSRRLIDPRVSARELADRVGLSEAGVRARLAGLRRQRLLGRSAVGVNPSLFGASLVVADVPVRTPRESERLFRDLEVLDGVVFARDLLDEEDRKVSVYLAADSPSGVSRRTSLLTRLAPSGVVRGPSPYWIPPCDRALTPLDRTLLGVFRSTPDGALAQYAAAAHVSLRTVSRRLELLLTSHACWWSHGSESEEWPLALLMLSLNADADAAAVATEVSRRCESWLPVAPDGLGSDPADRSPRIAGLVPVGTPSALEGLVRRVLAIDGVANLRRTFGLRSASFPQWVDDRLGAQTRRVG